MTNIERQIIEALVKVMDDVVANPDETRASLKEFVEEMSYLLARTLIMWDEVRASSRQRSREYWTRHRLNHLWDLSKDNREENES
jgi:hypothetical protein